VVSVYIITFWQEKGCACEADPVWSPDKVMPEGASSTAAVRSALVEVLKYRQERQQGAAITLKRVSLSVSKRVSGAIASWTLSNVLRVGIAGPVGAGKTSLATSLAIALERLVPYWSSEITGIFDNYRVRTEEIKRKNDGTTATPYKEPEPAPAAQRGPAGPSAGQDQPRHGPHIPIITLVGGQSVFEDGSSKRRLSRDPSPPR
jgi:hypothetical protein